MHTQSHKLWLGRLFALIPTALTTNGCFNAVVGDAEICFDDGDGGYAAGEKYQRGCETCVCKADGGSECTGSCDDDDGGTKSDSGLDIPCSYRGKTVAPGQYITTGYECEACYCAEGGKLYCQEYECPADGGAPVCFLDGNAYAPGKFTPEGYDCTCSCTSSGKVDCEPDCINTTWGDAGWDPYVDGGYDDSPSYDGGRPPWLDASVDGGPTYYDAGLPLDAGWYACVYDGKNFDGTILTGDGCNTCTCLSDGKMFCTMNKCLADGGAGGCTFQGKWMPVGTHLFTGSECNTCDCIGDGQLACESRACPGGDPTPPVDAGTWGGYCEYEGKKFQVGEYVPSSKTCAKCYCAESGAVECDASACMMPSGCSLGETLFSVGEELVCADGCNTCTCGSKTDSSTWSMTKIACPALPAIMACPAGVSSSAFPAQLVYREGDALAVVDSRCANGQTLDYGLCWEGDLTKAFVQLYVFSTGAQRACNAAAQERVFSLQPLRQALVGAFPNQPDIKASLHGSGSTLSYTFRAP